MKNVPLLIPKCIATPTKKKSKMKGVNGKKMRKIQQLNKVSQVLYLKIHIVSVSFWYARGIQG